MGRKRTVECEVEIVDLEGAQGWIDGVQVTCSRCGNEATSFGTSPASVRRCMALLNQTCPEDEDNYYVADDGSDED